MTKAQARETAVELMGKGVPCALWRCNLLPQFPEHRSHMCYIFEVVTCGGVPTSEGKGLWELIESFPPPESGQGSFDIFGEAS